MKSVSVDLYNHLSVTKWLHSSLMLCCQNQHQLRGLVAAFTQLEV